MTRGAGVVRSAESLDGRPRRRRRHGRRRWATARRRSAAGELANLLQLADALLVSALRPHREPGRPRRAASTPRPTRRGGAGSSTAHGRRPAGAGPSVSERRGGRRRTPGRSRDAVDARPGRGPRPRRRPDGGAGARGRRRRTSRCGPATTACWPAGTAPPRRSGASTPSSSSRWHAVDGTELSAGDTVLEVTGPLRPILTAERTALNFLGHLSGIATLTAQFVAAAHESNPSVEVLDTRKTTPGLRVLEKAAVRAGGGTSHRAGPLRRRAWSRTTTWPGRASPTAVRRARALWPGRLVEIECDALDQVAEAARAGADAVLLDNMDPGTVVEAIARGPPGRAGAHPDRGLGWRDPRHHRRLRRGRAGPDLGRGADPLGPGARPGARPHLDRRGRTRRGERRTDHRGGVETCSSSSTSATPRR